MRLLGIDYGLKRIGLAIGNSQSQLISPYRCLSNRGREAFFADILDIIHKEHIQGIVIGYPLRHDGTSSTTTLQVKNIIKRLAARLVVPIFVVNELLSSYEAEDRLSELKHMGISSKANLDQVAACIILERYFTQPVEPFTAFKSEDL